MTRGRPWTRWLAVAAVAVAILVGSVTPAGTARLPRGPLGLIGLDKWLHAIAFGVLALTLGFALASTRPPDPTVVVAAVAIAVAYGVGVEVVQRAVPTRRFDTWDILADAAGAAVGVSAWRVARHLRGFRDRFGGTP